ncbi:tRNA pseudouridine(55) synthase TruB [Bifidobacterium sp. ESL0769]|uniref:tRNA pseudouridine synthase B n=1 Tax=Bifidobacterium sp. ESL0769 TaxID=2983229 RepID=UPI0023F93EB8|nr:tRNA pseudouridine(55) synthase TruB [Bifidobacterium sp. ESL0769]WEV67860.1 tRNA pseudouridine(55) synthase TruB [Bifidobacterium sp. ESL0769]
MSKKSKKPELSGLVVVDKPLGVTSHDVVAAVRGELHMRRVGHAGTLDPQASGVLVIGFGHGTRLLNYIVDHTKTYEATIRLGQTSTTDDSEGEITTVVSVRLADNSDNGVEVNENANSLSPAKNEAYSQGFSNTSPKAIAADDLTQSLDGELTSDETSGNARVLTFQQIKQAINEHLTGDIKQVPSSYSAVRVNGRHAYELARQGKTVKLDARSVTISEFIVLGARNTEATIKASEVEDGENESITSRASVVDVDVRISCSTGTYIRSLGRDLGRLLGVGGYLTKLRRTRVGKFDLADPQLAERVVTAHAKPHTFTNREGVTLTLNRAVLDVDADELKRRALTMLEAAQRTMPTIPISDEDAKNLRFGRRLPITIAAGASAEYGSGAADAGDNSTQIVKTADDKAMTNDGKTSTNASGTKNIAAVYLPQTEEVVGIVEPANNHELKSVVVFPQVG